MDLTSAYLAGSYQLGNAVCLGNGHGGKKLTDGALEQGPTDDLLIESYSLWLFMPVTLFCLLLSGKGFVASETIWHLTTPNHCDHPHYQLPPNQFRKPA